ncbi:MAG: low molecular weight phosphotyrosine protein phosphatase [Thermomonas sp.]|uniref:low molecular weight protein-tyrosine-phosphatase n=1 Tax=Thermomonas sp. TaxID=1971895 RepID=UPI001ED0C013|nr:low molecular weight protein-tyrosine-phosphatase [Thermomonas sp.]MBV2208223.1 low molecular weight phosphotyrosine protein phosphatase [Thermomonas sp.]
MARLFSILMVCMGNICRSPTAEGVLRARLQEANLTERVKVDSAATGSSHVGHPPDERAIACAKKHGVDITALRARRVALEDFDEFDLILCADRTILHEVRIRKPRTSLAEVELLLEWSGVGKKDVPDPYYGNTRDFEHAFKLIDSSVQGIIERVQQGRL